MADGRRYNPGMVKHIRNMLTMSGLAVLIGTATTILAAPAAAIPAPPPEPPAIEPSTSWLTIAYAAVGVIAICVVAFKNARRTHLD